MARHLMTLATLFVQAHPKASVLNVYVRNLHRERRANAGERVDHQPD
jgi:hypothetical protein